MLGKILSFQLFGQVIVVLNSAKVAKDLLEKRSAIYSDRPPLPIYDMCVLNSSVLVFRLTSIRMGWDWVLALARNGELWRQGRRMLDRGLRPAATASYRSMIQARTHVFLSRLLENPRQWEDNLDLSVGFLFDSYHVPEIFGKCSAFKGS
jgi:cytochrome P450